MIAEEGGSPSYLDLFHQLFVTWACFCHHSGGEISAGCQAFLTQALAHRFPVVALDFPKPDGFIYVLPTTPSFVGGAYFDICAGI